MSATTTYCCDRCREVITADRHLIAVESGRWRQAWPSFDLCGECSNALVRWLVERTEGTPKDERPDS